MNTIPTFVRDGGEAPVRTAPDVEIVPEQYRLALLFGNLHGLVHDIGSAPKDTACYGDFLELFSQVVEMSGRDVEAVYAKAYKEAVARGRTTPDSNVSVVSIADLHATLVTLSRDARNRGLQEKIITLVVGRAIASYIELDDLLKERAEQLVRYGGFDLGKFGSGGR
jgi:hypothetical protein